MNAVITDVLALESVSPVDISAYLRANGWEPHGEVKRGIVAQWLRSLDGNIYDVLVPLNREVKDFTRRISETLATLSLVEQRSQLEVLSDLQDSTADVVRWRCIQDDSRDGTISLEQGHQLIAQARSQLLAAACSAVSARQYFASRKPAQAVDYMSKARLAQSERGSYVIAVRSPVPPHFHFEEDSEEVTPFSRRAVETLATGLVTLLDASNAALQDGNVDRENIAQMGVSANLCDAMATMLMGDGRRSVEVSFSYARTRNPSSGIPRSARFISELSPVISEIGRDLRETATREDFELIGFVTDLSRGPSDELGTATIQGLVDNQFKRVEVQAESHDYAILASANTGKRPIACVGELIKEQGRTFRLRNARAFQIVENG
jgi:hypothetical protein